MVDESARIDSIPRWFDGVKMNFAENLLYSRIPGEATSRRGLIGKEDGKVALTEVREGYTEVRDVSWGQLRKEVGVLASAMKEHGVKKGDRVVVVASNSVDTLKVFLAVTTLGGLFSSSSTDMGVQGVLQRALQVTPKVRQQPQPKHKADLCSSYSWTILQFTTERRLTSETKCPRYPKA